MRASSSAQRMRTGERSGVLRWIGRAGLGGVSCWGEGRGCCPCQGGQEKPLGLIWMHAAVPNQGCWRIAQGGQFKRLDGLRILWRTPPCCRS